MGDGSKRLAIIERLALAKFGFIDEEWHRLEISRSDRKT